MKQKLKKIIKAAVVIFLAVIILLPQITSAQQFKVEGCGGLVSFFSHFPTCAIAWGTFALSYIIGLLLGFLINVASWAAGLALNFNRNILGESNTLVVTGWKIVRDITNLGFVLVIIVIAIATILRFESYGVKRLLPKLIAAAVLVNFSLTIAGVFIDFSNVLTDFFFSRVDESASPFRIANQVAGAFNPQRFFQTIESGGQSATTGEEPQAANTAPAITGFTNTLIIGIASVVFTAVFLSIMLFVLLAWTVLLLLRYLWLSFLLILSPIIWLFWVIPDLSGQFSKWWNKFLEWIFFAPASAFFMYLALRSVEGIGNSIIISKTEETAAAALAPDLQLIFSQGAQMIVLSGIMLGGLLVAQQMGIQGASAALKVGNKGVGVIKGFSGRKWQQIKGRYSETVKDVGLKMAEVGARRGKILKAITAPIRGAGLATANWGVTQGSKAVELEQERFKNLSVAELNKLIPGFNKTQKLAVVTRAIKEGKLDQLDNPEQYLRDDWKKEFDIRGLAKDFGTLQVGLGVSAKALKLLKAGKVDEAREEEQKFIANLSSSDIAKIQSNAIFGRKDNEALQKLLAEGITINNPGDFGKIFSNAKGAARGNVITVFNQVKDEFGKLSVTVPGFGAGVDMKKRASELETAMQNILAVRRIYGFVPGAGGEMPPTTPQTPGQPPTPKPPNP